MKKKLGINASEPVRKPQKITCPRSAPRIPAVAMGPGVGGTREWLEDKPRVSATVVAAKGNLPLNDRDLLIGCMIIKALSPKTGMDSMNPVIIIASMTDFSPMNFKTL